MTRSASSSFRAGSIAALCLATTLACPRRGPGPGDPPGGPTGASIDRAIVARCLAPDGMPAATLFAPGGAPFTVLVGRPGAWRWSGTSSDGALEVPLDKLAHGGPVHVFVVSGAVTAKDRIATRDDAELNRQISRRQAGAPAVELAVASGARRVPIPRLCLDGDDCTTPQCPPK